MFEKHHFVLRGRLGYVRRHFELLVSCFDKLLLLAHLLRLDAELTSGSFLTVADVQYLPPVVLVSR